MEQQAIEIINAVIERGTAHALYQALYHYCQFPIEKVRKILSEKSPEEMTDDELRELTDRNQDAAWAMYVQMLTRITTQPLPDEDGGEQTALDSVYKLFEITRDILTEYGREAPEFSKLAVLILNQKSVPSQRCGMFRAFKVLSTMLKNVPSFAPDSATSKEF